MTNAELKDRARATWSAGDYDAVVDRIWSAGADVVRRVGVGPGDEVLDVACGTGNASIPAAEAGAKVTGLDLTPELFDGARRRAQRAGVELELVEGDAEDLPFADESFDVVLSTFGCMFAPDHRRAAEEIARVLRPGGRLGIAAWTPEGSVGDFFKSLSTLGPPPPPGFQPPVLWGTEGHVSELFEGTGVAVRFEESAVQFRFDSAEEALNEYWDRFGPIIMLRRALEPEGRGDEIRTALTELFGRWNELDGEGLGYPGAYLVTLGEKSA
jgi:SAM-dependent methyltransferase